MNADQVAALRDLLAPTGWLERTRSFARTLRNYTRTPRGLLVVGTPADEPWHMTAHLADESRLAEIPELEPTLVRWAPPAGAPAHLRVGIDRLQAATRGETLLVVSPFTAPDELLERLSDVRHAGATILALDRGDPGLSALAHEALAVPAETAPLSFDAAQHLVSAAAGEPFGTRHAAHRPSRTRNGLIRGGLDRGGLDRGGLADGSLADGSLADGSRSDGSRSDGKRSGGKRSGGSRSGDSSGDSRGDGRGAGGGRHAQAPAGASLRARLAHLLDTVSGTPAGPSD